MIHSCLTHDNIVKLHEYTENEKEFVLFMEYCNDANYFEEKLVNVSAFVLARTWFDPDCSELFNLPRDVHSFHDQPVMNFKWSKSHKHF